MIDRMSKRLAGVALFLWAAASLSAAVFLFAAQAADVLINADLSSRAIRLETYRTHSRILFKLDEHVDSVWTDKKDGFQILFKNILLTDLGAPFGAEAEWLRQLVDVRDHRIASLQLEQTPKGVLVTGKWKYATGDQAPANPGMERFEFRQANPPSYVIDFWEKKGPTVAEMRVRLQHERQIASLKSTEEKARQREERRRALAKKLEEAGDLQTFCKSPVSDQNDVFLHFSALHKPFDFKQWFSLNSPDAHYNYLEPKSAEADAKYVRVALQLYRESKPALAIRAVEFLEAEQPKSKYVPEMKFLKASALTQLGHDGEAEKVLREIVTDSRGTPVALYAGMFLAGKSLSQEKHLAALENFLWLIRNYKGHRLGWVFHFGVAEALFALGQTERTVQEYEWVIAKTPDHKAQAEAAFRLGDAFMERKLYEQAIAAYYKAMNFYKDEAQSFASLHLNRAEALYWLSKADSANSARATAAFKEFLNRFPSDPSGWRAMIRLGELAARSSHEEERKEASSWFLNAVNTYPFSPGAILGRLRLAPCGDHGGLTAEALKRFFETDAASFNGAGQVKMEGYHELMSLSRIRSMVAFNDYSEAVAQGAAALRKTIRTEYKIILGNIFNRTLRKQVQTLLTEGKKYEALAFYNLYAPSVYKQSEPLIPDFLLALAEAAVDLQLGTLAERIMNSYRDAVAVFDEKILNRKIAQAKTDIDERMRISNELLTEAKALWIKGGASSGKEIRAKLDGVDAEFARSFEKEILLGLVAEKNGELKEATVHAMKAHVLVSGQTPGLMAQVGHWVASLQVRVKNNRVAITVLEEVERRLNSAQRDPASEVQSGDLGLPVLPDLNQIGILKAELFEQEKRWSDAAEVYAQVISRGVGDNRVLYSYASALRKKGTRESIVKAKATLEQVANSGQEDFWKKMAQEALENEKTSRSR